MASDDPRTALAAVVSRRFLRTGWAARSLGYLVTTPPLALAAAAPLAVLALPWIVLVVWAADGSYPRPLGTVVPLVVAGAVLLAGLGPLVALPLAALERRRLRLADRRPTLDGHRRPAETGLWPWLRTRYTEPVTWKALAYALLLVTVVPVLYLAAGAVVLQILVLAISPLLAGRSDGAVALGVTQITTAEQAIPYALAGLVLLPAVPYVIAAAAGVHGALARSLLHEGDQGALYDQLAEVARSRARLVDAFEAERRRIERDLHDGAQSRLVGLTLKLGLARLDLPDDSPAAKAVAEAHEEAKQLMAQLRRLIRGIHPRVLTDRGLPAALRELADDSPVPVTVSTNLTDRLPVHLEVTAYYVVVEALNNVVKHAGATGVTVSTDLRGGELTVQIADDGAGGADPARGSGLTGLADRVTAVGGTLLLSSPLGGPTVIRVELPCDPT